MIQEIVSILRFLLPFRGIFAILKHKSILLIEEAHRPKVFCFFGEWSFLIALILLIIVKIIVFVLYLVLKKRLLFF